MSPCGKDRTQKPTDQHRNAIDPGEPPIYAGPSWIFPDIGYTEDGREKRERNCSQGPLHEARVAAREDSSRTTSDDHDRSDKGGNQPIRTGTREHSTATNNIRRKSDRRLN